MKFYDFAMAPNPRRTRILAAEKGIDLDIEQVDLRNGGQMSDEFKAINPRCTVPALVLDSGLVLTENLAIATYFEEIKPEPPMMGTTAEEKANVMMWQARIEQEGLMAVAEAFRNTSPGFAGRAITGQNGFEQIAELAERGLARFQHFCPMLEKQLGDNQFLLGDQITLVDVTAYTVIDFSGWIKQAIPDDCPKLKAWHERMAARPSAKA